MPNKEKQILSFENTLSLFFNEIVSKGNSEVEYSPLLQTIISIYHQKPLKDIYSFSLDDESVDEVITNSKKKLYNCPSMQKGALNDPIMYLLEELICNIQQHAQVETGYVFLDHDQIANNINIVIADFGITIYGSYVNAQKHLDILGDSDADALNLAQNGYSVKNLPETENRGYGISSNMRMTVEGLSGEFAVLSGNALLIHSKASKKILSLPPEIDFKGTMVIVRIPDEIPNNFNLYKYIG